LIMGGDLRALDVLTLDLLTNDEVLAVNQASHDNRPWFYADGTRIWTARAAQPATYYLALFNTDDGPAPRSVVFDFKALNFQWPVKVRDLWARRDLGAYSDSFAAELPPHGAGLYRLSA